ncbi:winged helix-turn-helix domain-containing protein [Arthrobacter sp. R4-81]
MTDNQVPAVVEPIPKWHEFMVPVLRVLSDGKPRGRRDLLAAVLDEAGMTESQRAVMLSSGQSKAENRIGWAMSDLTRATAVAKPERGSFVITDLGRDLLRKNPHVITQDILKEIPAYRDYEPQRQNVSKADPVDITVEDSELDPIEQIERGIQLLRADLATDLLKRLQERHPDLF